MYNFTYHRPTTVRQAQNLLAKNEDAKLRAGTDPSSLDKPFLDFRRWPVTEDGTSLFWCGLNKAKRSVALDLRSAEGRELAPGEAEVHGLVALMEIQASRLRASHGR